MAKNTQIINYLFAMNISHKIFVRGRYKYSFHAKEGAKMLTLITLATHSRYQKQ